MPRDAEARLADGTRIRYRVWGGERPGRRFALVHSLAMDAAFWTPVAEALSSDCEVLALDCRGHGKSDKPPGPYRVERFADDLAGVLDAVGWRSARVAGASMGGCVALAFAARHPRRLSGLGLIDTTAWYGAEAQKTWEGRAGKALEEGMAALVEFQKTRWFSDAFRETHPDRVEAAIEVFLANDVEAYAESCRMLGNCDMRAALPGIAVPTEIVVGEEDYATPVAMAEAMRAAIPGAGLEVIEGARHFTPLEVPERIAAALRRLL
ncbi:MAG TPA: alpha/beta fold hydrolase [Kiloniellales bacterium]|nr:alpha/beta fold hydrolase [Kiloniellales bacterium]